MTAGAEVVGNDVVRKIEIEEKCVAGLNGCDLNEVGDVATVDDNVGGNGNGFVSGNGKDDADDSSYVFVGGRIEVSAADPDDAGGVNEDDFVPISGSSDEADQLKKEEFGMENGGISVDLLTLETKGVDHGSMIVSDSDVKGVTDDVHLENGSTVDPPVELEANAIALEVNGYLEKKSEEEAVVKSAEEVDNAEEISDVEIKTDDIGSGVTFDPELTLNTTDTAEVTTTESESTIHPSDLTISKSMSTPDVINSTDESFSASHTISDPDCEAIVDGEPECISDPIDVAECQVTVDGSGKPSEDLEGQVTADGSESSASPTKEQDGQVTVDETSKPSEDLASQVIADEPESSRSSIKEQECDVSVDGTDSIGCLVDNEECPESVESEVSANHTEEVDRQSKGHQAVIISEDNVQSEPTFVGDGLKAEHESVSERDGQVTVDESSKPSEVLASQVTADEPEFFGSSIKEQECEVSGDGSDTMGSLVDNPVCPESVESETSGNHTKEVDRQPKEHQAVITSEVNVQSEPTFVGDGLKAEHESVSVSVPYQSDDKKTEEIEFGLSTESEKSPDSGLVLPENTGALADEEADKFDGILETGETQICGTEADRSVLLMLNCMNEKPEEMLEKPMDGSSETVTEPVETGANSEDMKEQIKTEDEIQESQIVITVNAHDDLNLGDNTTESANGAEVPLETETNSDPSIHESTASQYEVGSSIDQPQEVSRPEESSENVETVESECDNNDLLVAMDHDSVSNPDELVAVEQKVEIVAKADTFDDEKESEVKDAPVEYVPQLFTENITAEGMACETGVNDVGVTADEEQESEVTDAPVGAPPTLSFSDTIVNCGTVIEFGSFGRDAPTHNTQKEGEDIDGIQSDEIPTSSVEGSVIDATDVQNEVVEVLPYNFLIKIPRYEDENFRDQIRSAQLLVEEKTRLRDAIRVQIQEKRAMLKAHNEAYNAAKMEETAARRLVRLKRQEIDSVQVVINRWKNAMSVEDINLRLSNMEHMIQHETLSLKDEKQFIREIRQLATLRNQLSSNMGSHEEIRQAIDQKDHNEERMKTLRKELDSLKDKASKAETVVKTIGKTYDEESRRARELQIKFRAADDVRQNVYARLNSLKKQSYDKNKNFRQFKEDLMAARDFASHGNKDALHRLCANQVETFMEQWNNNDEFRKDYVSMCNMNASRRQRGLDGGPLVPDDVAPVLHAHIDENADNSPVSIPGNVKSVSVVSIPVEDTNNNRSIENVVAQKIQILKPKGIGKPTTLGSADMTKDKDTELAEDGKKEEENTLTKAEIESAKMAEELKKEEIAAKLKEQRRQEERAKAIEALERKKRNAEKAQMRAEIRARKEAEQREKEREKRLRKKEKKKTGSRDGSVNEEETAASSESSNEALTKDTEPVSKETVKRKIQPPPHLTKQQRQQVKPKPIPPPLVNRNRKRWLQWGKVAAAIAGVFLLFMLGNTNYFRHMFSGLI